MSWHPRPLFWGRTEDTQPNPAPFAINALPVIVIQYRGATPGKRVTRAEALRAKSASPCWSGTDQPGVQLRVRVSLMKTAGFPSGRATVPVAWVVPTQEAFGGFGRLYSGVLAGQDIWPCGPRST